MRKQHFKIKKRAVDPHALRITILVALIYKHYIRVELRTFLGQVRIQLNPLAPFS
jgi:hypothetical protein